MPNTRTRVDPLAGKPNPFKVGDYVTMIPTNFYEGGRSFGPWVVDAIYDSHDGAPGCGLHRIHKIGNQFEDIYISFYASYLRLWDGKPHGHGFHYEGRANYSQYSLMFWHDHPYKDRIIEKWKEFGELVADYNLEVTTMNIRGYAALIRHNDVFSAGRLDNFFHIYEDLPGSQYKSFVGVDMPKCKKYFLLHEQLLYQLIAAVDGVKLTKTTWRDNELADIALTKPSEFEDVRPRIVRLGRSEPSRPQG